jgi:hypothetical protein
MEPSKSPLRRLEFVRLSKRWTSETDDSTDAKAVITIMGKAERNKTEYRTNLEYIISPFFMPQYNEPGVYNLIEERT